MYLDTLNSINKKKLKYPNKCFNCYKSTLVFLPGCRNNILNNVPLSYRESSIYGGAQNTKAQSVGAQKIGKQSVGRKVWDVECGAQSLGPRVREAKYGALSVGAQNAGGCKVWGPKVWERSDANHMHRF